MEVLFACSLLPENRLGNWKWDGDPKALTFPLPPLSMALSCPFQKAGKKMVFQVHLCKIRVQLKYRRKRKRRWISLMLTLKNLEHFLGEMGEFLIISLNA